jgi:hypothetical protein
MQLSKRIVVLVFSLTATAALSQPAAAQSTNCTSSQQAAVQCFVANAVATDLTKPRYGMTLAQFEAYGVAVSEILRTNHTYLVLIGTSSAIADAMPPTNANGSANQSAQDVAVTQIVSAEVSEGLANTTVATVQDLQWFSLDVTGAMNDNNGVMALLTPGVSLRIIDSYVVTGTTNGTVNWTVVDASLSQAVDNFIASGMFKVPGLTTTARLKAFVNSLAHIIYDYKVSTGRKSL